MGGSCFAFEKLLHGLTWSLGPNTLAGYLQEFTRITADMATGQPSATAPAPYDLSDVQISLHAPGIPFDRTPIKTKFGQVVDGSNVQSNYTVSRYVYASVFVLFSFLDQFVF